MSSRFLYSPSVSAATTRAAENLERVLAKRWVRILLFAVVFLLAWLWNPKIAVA